MNSENKPYFPVFMNLTNQTVVVVGAGTIAKRRIRTLISFTDHLIVVAPEVNQELKQLELDGKIKILRKRYESQDLEGAAMVIAATNDKKINRGVYDDCKARGILVNVCTDKQKCDFYFPGIVQDEHVVVGVSTSGKEPGRTKELAARIRELLRGKIE